MKKLFAIMLGLVMVFGLVGCSATPNGELSDNLSQSVVDDLSDATDEVTEDTSSDVEINIAELKQGDEVSIVGQVAGSTLVNGNTLWVQVKQRDGDFVLYHCQLKDEYIEQGENFKTLDVAKVKGSFLSLMDLEMENTMPVVTLYDCELK